MTGAQAAITGVSGTSFSFVAKQDVIVTSDGDSTLIWGYALVNEATGESRRAQYPGPTLILTDQITRLESEFIPDLNA